MNQGSSLKEYVAIFAAWLRSVEKFFAKGDPEKLRIAEEISDAELARKWLWIIALIGGPACFIGLPFLLSGIHSFVPVVVMGMLWKMAKGLMGIVFIIFLVAVFATVRKSDDC